LLLLKQLVLSTARTLICATIYKRIIYIYKHNIMHMCSGPQQVNKSLCWAFLLLPFKMHTCKKH